jgi:hypothetical protein
VAPGPAARHRSARRLSAHVGAVDHWHAFVLQSAASERLGIAGADPRRSDGKGSKLGPASHRIGGILAIAADRAFRTGVRSAAAAGARAVHAGESRSVRSRGPPVIPSSPGPARISRTPRSDGVRLGGAGGGSNRCRCASIPSEGNRMRLDSECSRAQTRAESQPHEVPAPASDERLLSHPG